MKYLWISGGVIALIIVVIIAIGYTLPSSIGARPA
jgi:hypothetical protein